VLVFVAWLESVPAVIVDCSTFGMAVLGGYVALNPPKEERVALKRVYVVSFVVLGILGIVANVWQRNVEAGKQAILQRNETDARTQFSADLAVVKSSNQTILNFVAHPPAGFSREQVVSVVRTFLEQQHNDKQTAEVKAELRSITMVPQVVEQLRDPWELKGKVQDINIRAWEELTHFRNEHPDGKSPDGKGEPEIEARRQIELNEAEERYGPEAEEKLILDADSIRKELLKHIPPEKRIPADNEEEQKFAKALKDPDSLPKSEAASYLERLAGRVPPLK
jgi:hypothetical protein